MTNTPHASDSAVQRAAECSVRELIQVVVDCSLAPETLDLGAGVKINIDGISRDKRILCEIYSRIGRLKSAQSDKVAADMLKLMLAEKALGGPWRKIICLADADAAKSFQGRTWLGAAVRGFGFELHVVDVPPDVRSGLLAAQAKQIMVNPPGG